MGNKGGKISAGGLKPKELAVLSETTRFTEAELRALWSQFASLKGGADSAATSLVDLHISESEFQAALGFHGVGGSGGSVFLRRIFALFDENKDGLITFEEFCISIAALTPTAKPEARMKVAFELYDTARRGAISPADVTFLLAHSFRENGAAISDAAVERIVADTFRQYDVNKDGLLDFAEFKHMCQLQPNVLRPLTINVSEIIAAATSVESKA
jgi:Ca2+-binding EF-hand superfamily protein